MPTWERVVIGSGAGARSTTGMLVGEDVPVGGVVAADVGDVVAGTVGVGGGGEVAVGAGAEVIGDEAVGVVLSVGPGSTGSPGEDGVDGAHTLGAGGTESQSSGERRSGLVNAGAPCWVRRGKTPSSK